MPVGDGRAEAGQRVRIDLGDRGAEGIGCRPPARAEHDGDVVVVDAGGLGEGSCGLACRGMRIGVEIGHARDASSGPVVGGAMDQAQGWRRTCST